MRAAWLIVAFTAAAHADTVTVGMFAPTAPFSSAAARVELATRLGDQIGRSLGGTGSGKVYARAGDFAAAVRKGDIAIALVDAAYLANAGGAYTVIAVATRGGEAAHAWQLVARGGVKLAELKGKRVIVPGIGGRETELVLNVFLGGELGKDFMKIDTAPDTASALAALGLGKVDAAVVPAGVELPGGVSAVLPLPAIPGPVLVAYGSIGADRKAAIAAAAAGFHGDATVAGFRSGDAEVVQAVARRFVVPVKRGPLAVPAVRLLVGDLVEGRTFAIERTPATVFAIRTTDVHH
jgi:hypothetical protein